ncbi:MAG TPA: hypothetical protein VNE61_14105 [Ktedonobacteraceae bacterium]|nr:hypothetical protein [Ktedonobacteraceae bacterium]
MNSARNRVSCARFHNRGKVIAITKQQDQPLEANSAVDHDETARENAKQVLRESGLAQMLQEINKTDLKRRGWFEEYESILLLKWGTGYTRRHLWIDVVGDNIRFRLALHRQCTQAVPQCDGEYHTFTREMWSNPNLLHAELYRYYRKPVAESSDD